MKERFKSFRFKSDTLDMIRKVNRIVAQYHRVFEKRTMTMTAAAKKEACSCPKCVHLCERNPGWMTPQEARDAIAAGLAARLMKDWLEPCEELKNECRIFVLAPAACGHEGTTAPEMGPFAFFWIKGQCTFLRDGLCELHNTTFKP